MDNGHEPATKADLAALEKRLGADIQALEQRLGGEMKALEDRLVEAFRDGQTESLKAFYTYAQSTDLKLKDMEIADFTARQRITAAESRITEIERRLNMPPAP